MRRIVVVLAGIVCGSGASPIAAPSTRNDAWDALAVGSVVTLRSDTDPVHVVTVRVVSRSSKGIELAWTLDGKPLEVGSRELPPPHHIVLGRDVVTFEHEGFADAIYSRRPTKPILDANWTKRIGSAVCYGDGPHSEVACENDLCGERALCIDAHGVSSGWGEYWPYTTNYTRAKTR